ncbi:nucleoporin FG repeated region domain-containing protein [Phthorimaea operculella]|nr:nucleoporin FG repeated region domain-containing protein [Phthorimaea operculella]
MSFSFGAPASAPATGGLTSGFSFGANKPATPGFGLSATSQPSTGLFGSTATTSAPAFGTGTPAFGATTGFGNTSAFGASAAPAFGATSTAPTFGTAGATPAFGATSTAPAFGSTTTPAFGATPGFGATSTAPTFGATSTPAFGAASTAPAFGSTTTPAFGQTGTTGFGTGGLNFGAGSNTSAAPTGLTLGGPATTSAGLGGFGFGGSAQGTGLGGGLFGATTTASTGLFGAKSGTTTVTAAPSLGLGGVAPAGATSNTTSGDGKTEPPKQTKLPNEISTTVDSFKEFVKKQKSLSSEIMRVSIKPLHKVAREAEATLRMALTLSAEVAEVCKARAHSRRLRSSAAAALATAESVANSTELEGSAPPAYVSELISELEQQLVSFRRQMEVADKQVQAQPKLLTEQELTLGIRRMHESLVALAGRLQAVHAQVNEQKEQYLNLRKYVLNEHTNVFDTEPSNTSLDEILWDAAGSRKKQRSTHFTSGNPASAVLSDPRAALGKQVYGYSALMSRNNVSTSIYLKYVVRLLSLELVRRSHPEESMKLGMHANTSLDEILWDAAGSRKKQRSTHFTSGNPASAVLSDPRAALGNLQQLAGPTPFTYIGNTISPFPNPDTSSVSWQPQPQTSFNTSLNASTDTGTFQLQKPPGKRGKQ